MTVLIVVMRTLEEIEDVSEVEEKREEEAEGEGKGPGPSAHSSSPHVEASHMS